MKSNHTALGRIHDNLPNGGVYVSHEIYDDEYGQRWLRYIWRLGDKLNRSKMPAKNHNLTTGDSNEVPISTNKEKI